MSKRFGRRQRDELKAEISVLEGKIERLRDVNRALWDSFYERGGVSVTPNVGLESGGRVLICELITHAIEVPEGCTTGMGVATVKLTHSYDREGAAKYLAEGLVERMLLEIDSIMRARK